MSFSNTVTVDLRTITTVEAAKSIEKIENCCTVIMPENADPEVLNALTLIPKQNVASIISLPNQVKLSDINGKVTLTAAMLKQEFAYSLNGKAIFEEYCDECNAYFLINGKLIYPKGCPVKVLSANGQAKAYDYEHYVTVDDDFELDAMTLELMNYKTLLDIDGDLRIAKDVTIEMLKEKMPYFIVDGDIRCNQSVLAFVKLRAEVDGRYRVKAAVYEDDED